MSENTHLTTDELALRWSLNKGTLRNWRSFGMGPQYIKLGKGKPAKVLYPLVSILDYEKKCKISMNP